MLVTPLVSLCGSEDVGDARDPLLRWAEVLQAVPRSPCQAAHWFPPIPSPGISEDSKVEAPAFTDAIRMYRQSKEQYGTWDMLCGNETQVRTCVPRLGLGGDGGPG